MSINIKVDRNATWHPGDVVSGSVVFQSREQFDIQRIDITFDGTMWAKETRSRGQNGSVTYKGEVILFRQAITLFQGPYTLPPTTKEWPFQFHLPRDCREARPSKRYQPSNATKKLDPNPLQALPPSMWDNDNSMFASRKECGVNYKLFAKYEKASFFKGNISVTVPLKVETYRDEKLRQPPRNFHPWSSQFLISSYYLDPRMEERALTFKEKIKSTFGSKEIPQVWLKLAAKLPDVIIAGERIPLLLSLALGNQSTEMKQLPTVELKNFKITLASQTHQMVAGGGGLFSSSDSVGLFGHDHIVEQWEGSIVLGGDLDLRDLADVRRSQKPIVPSFDSFIIGRGYNLRISGEFECAQKRQKFGTWAHKEVVVLPSDCEGDPRIGPDGMPIVAAPQYHEDAGPSSFEQSHPQIESLPAYDTVMKT